MGKEGLIEIVADADRDVLPAATSAGPTGDEVLAMLTLAVEAEVPLDQLRTLIHAYPTFSRAVEDAVRRAALTAPPGPPCSTSIEGET